MRAHREIRTAPAKAAAAGCLALRCVSLLCAEHGDSVIGECRHVRFVGGQSAAQPFAPGLEVEVSGAEDVELGVVIAEEVREHLLRVGVQVAAKGRWKARVKRDPAAQALSSPDLTRLQVYISTGESESALWRICSYEACTPSEIFDEDECVRKMEGGALVIERVAARRIERAAELRENGCFDASEDQERAEGDGRGLHVA